MEEMQMKRNLAEELSHFDRTIHLNSEDQTCKNKGQMRGGIEESKVDIKPFWHVKTDT